MRRHEGRRQQKHLLRALAGTGAALCLAMPARPASAALPATTAPPPLLAARDLGDLSLEQLADIVVSTVSGRAEPLAAALGSAYVITAEDIRRAGATSLQEALRLAPNLQIARAGALGYAITARGFNGTLANKLLVLMDGRSIYTPTFSGVFWEAQDELLEDVQRIEVISGPGGVLWGANAVNGVINIITRSAADTQGTLAGAAVGHNETGAFVRHGGEIHRDAGGDGRWRAYVKRWRWKDLEQPGGAARNDGWDRLQAGFRADWGAGTGGDRGSDRAGFTLQGDVYEAEGHQLPNRQVLRGAHLLARWNRQLRDGDALRLQAYYDATSREQQHLDTADVELQHTLARRGTHRALWGAGARYSRDRIDNSAALAFFPAERSLASWNVYAVDEIALASDLDLSLGAKLDHNPYTGSEWLPSVRMGWRRSPAQFVWAAWSRAVRTPSRFDRDLYLPGAPPFLLVGGDFRSEVARVLEVGWRGQLGPGATLSATLFHHDLDDVRTVSPGPGGATVRNDREGRTRGFETWGALAVNAAWRLQAGYTRLDTDLSVKPGAVDFQSPAGIGSDPRSWWKLRSSHDLGGGWELDALARHHDALANRSVPAYTALDVRFGWRVSPAVELSLLLQNLLDPGHVEWAPAAAELQRAAFLKATLRF